MADAMTDRWREMTSAPKDGSRILAVIRASEQGASDVDVVRWQTPKRGAESCWTSTDSSHDCPIFYDDWEVAFWMPLPSTMAPVRTPGLAASLPEAPKEYGGSGI